jgi:dTDP-4-amino-4,6-dideoxygalactose transaminase
VKERLNLLEMEQKLPYIHNMVGWNYRMTEMQSAIGLAELDRFDSWNLPARRRNAHILMSRLKDLPQIKYMPVDTPERRNGWYVLAFSLDIENMNCTINQFVQAVAAEGAPCWKVFWPQCHTERAFTEKRAFGNSGFPFTSREYTDVASVDYSAVEVANSRWHEEHTFTCFAFPTATEEDTDQIADAIVKVIHAYSE